jgi:hypothetical protein
MRERVMKVRGCPVSNRCVRKRTPLERHAGILATSPTLTGARLLGCRKDIIPDACAAMVDEAVLKRASGVAERAEGKANAVSAPVARQAANRLTIL